MVAILKRHWRLKTLFTAIWALVFYLGYTSRVVYTRDPSPPWLFYSTLPALLVAFAWANQAEAQKRGLAGFAKFARWAGDVVGDVIVFSLTLFVPFLTVTILAPPLSYETRRSANVVLILSASATRNAITVAADQAGRVAGSDVGVPAPAPGDSIDFAHVGADGLIVLHSRKTDSTLLLIPRMEAGKTLWRCMGSPSTAFPASCRGDSGP